jgi:uncharacterized ParB-like nuclease family protein
MHVRLTGRTSKALFSLSNIVLSCSSLARYHTLHLDVSIKMFYLAFLQCQMVSMQALDEAARCFDE